MKNLDQDSMAYNNFTGAISEYLDADGLIGTHKNPTPVTNGNPIVSSAVAVCIDPASRELLEPGVLMLKADRFYRKKARSEDQITHDDVIGLCAFVPQHVYEFGSKHFWIMSNTGKIYWDAIAKPQQIAYYKLVNKRFTMLAPFLFLSLAMGAIFKGNASDRQLSYIIVKTLPKTFFMNIACKLWYWGVKKHWGSMRRVMFEYYNDSNHPFCVYMPE